MAAEVTPPEMASWYLSTVVSPLEGSSSQCAVGIGINSAIKMPREGGTGAQIERRECCTKNMGLGKAIFFGAAKITLI